MLLVIRYPVWVVDVLFAAFGVVSNGLQMTFLAGGNADLGPGRWNDELFDAGAIGVRQWLSVLIDVAESFAVTLPLPEKILVLNVTNAAWGMHEVTVSHRV